MSKIKVAFVGTESFYNNYDVSYLDNMRDVCKPLWESEIEDGSGDYDAEFHVIDSWLVIPESELCGEPNNPNCTTRDRGKDVDEWLRNNWNSTYNLSYYDMHVIIVGDYYNNTNDGDRAIAQQTAGTQTHRCCLLDIPEIESDTSKPGSPWRSLGYSGVAAHELLHMFLDEPSGYEHQYHVDRSGDTTIQYDPDANDYCYRYNSVDVVIENVSYCTKNDVQQWIDNHSDRFD